MQYQNDGTGGKVMSEYAETRKEIEKEIESRRQENEGRAKHMGLVVEDNKVLTGTSRKVSLSALREGAEKVKKIFREAAKAIRKEFENQIHDLQKNIDKCKQTEIHLDHKEKITKRDAVEIERAAARIKESKRVKRLAGQAEHTMIKDAKFLRKERIIQKRLRKRTEKKREKQKHCLMSAKLKW